MNLKNKLFCIIAISFFLTGCNQNNNAVKSVADKATQQKTMTKVQNDVNEIMSKDYNYVIKNMGIPYCTTYYINTNDIDKNNIVSLDSMKNALAIRLIYPKYSSENENGNSALYIELYNNKVNEVQTYDFSKYEIKDEEIKENTDLIVDMYNEKTSIQLNTMESTDFNKFIGLELECLNEIVNIDSSNFKVYDKNREKMIMGFFIDSKYEEKNEILVISKLENTISDIKILNESQTIDLIKNKMIK